MFQLFIGNPSISDGLSLHLRISPVPLPGERGSQSPRGFDIHVGLLSDELHGTLDLSPGISINFRDTTVTRRAMTIGTAAVRTSATILNVV
jgi:hypothetical protein